MFTSKQINKRGVIAGTVLAVAMSVSAGALAQPAPQPAPTNTQVSSKQVGAWAVIGWSQGYCAAERPVPGAAAGGGTLQFVVARVRTGYRLALSAPEWELKPQTAFPIELVAGSVWRSEATALVANPKVVVIELGADGNFMKKLATAPMIEVKAAQATFKLPLEKFAATLAEIDTCFAALKQPLANPFAPAAAAPKTANNS